MIRHSYTEDILLIHPSFITQSLKITLKSLFCGIWWAKHHRVKHFDDNMRQEIRIVTLYFEIVRYSRILLQNATLLIDFQTLLKLFKKLHIILWLPLKPVYSPRFLSLLGAQVRCHWKFQSYSSRVWLTATVFQRQQVSFSIYWVKL